ncbi:hypothetical protein GOA89_14765 [Sinorhizobium meliloti]|nr:hypothetical protein [Sinorhizobium meliloti]MDW9847558.1 hypothetical protein [Sinorhizobium meliloti]MDX0144059.1 hypothetical protein [Sinorhizobium meliloti]MDX0150484.1 hypothetical protein [Sinorhizobium meliloti]MDX0169736.1 hypothetical protein [Sinorhizobium meliloti]
MRDYGKVGPGFWTGVTGKRLRGDADAQIVALYLMTCPHANMIGIFHCPLLYISHDTGLPLEGASKGLQRLSEEGFCTLDTERDLIWVHEMARFQIADALKPKDNRIVNVAKELASLPKCQITRAFYEAYAERFLLVDRDELKDLRSPSQAPSKPLRSQKQEQEQEQEKKEEPVGSSKKRGSRLSPDWALPEEWRSYAVKKGLALKRIDIEAEKFKNHWLQQSGQRGVKADWSAAWRNWVLNSLDGFGKSARPAASERYRNENGDLTNDYLFARG